VVLDGAYQMKSPLLAPVLASVMDDGQPPGIIDDGFSSRQSLGAVSNWLSPGSPILRVRPPSKAAEVRFRRLPVRRHADL
jgi:hypothetical protein